MSPIDRILLGGVALWLGACALAIWGWTFVQLYKHLTSKESK